jgi:hypothetical protein
MREIVFAHQPCRVMSISSDAIALKARIRDLKRRARAAIRDVERQC